MLTPNVQKCRDNTMASRRLLYGAVFVLIWMLMMLFVYQLYVSRYGKTMNIVEKETPNNIYTTSANSIVEKELSSIICSNTSTIIREASSPPAIVCPNETIHSRAFCPPNASSVHDPCMGVRTLLNHSRCPLSQPFKVFFYNVHFPNLFSLQDPTLVGNLKALLVNYASWANTSDEACIFLAIVGPLRSSLGVQKLQEKIYGLPYWDGSGANHLLVDLEVTSTLDHINTSSAVVANNGAVSKQCAGVLNLNIPPFVRSFTSLPNVFDAPRSHLLCFETALKHVDNALVAYKDATLLSQHKFKVVIGCEGDDNISEHERMLGFCQSFEQRFHQCLDSTFYLVLGERYMTEGSASATYTYLLEALRCGAVPVVVGVDRLPFDHVIDWHKAVIHLPTLPPPSILSGILSPLQPQIIMDYRRQGHFLVNTYFIDQEHIVYTSIALLRSMYYHPPPPSHDFKARTIKLKDVKTTIPPSPQFLSNFSSLQSLRMWNNPPGPFFMYPVTPHTPPYDPDMFRFPAGNQVQSGSTGHVQGDEFRVQLRGNYPTEGFTVVALTYHRTKHLPSFLSNFKDCPFLSKVIVVWNNDDDPPEGMIWPDIGVPVEMVIVGRNSLNNRFLPFSNIETEAVLALDDDQLVPFNQLELAFRVWRENRERIVGWYDRTAVWGTDDAQWHYVWDPSCQTSMTLTGAAMFHKYYLYLYSYWMPQAARDMVDSQMNGEDIAMNFLIAYISRKPPIKIDLKGDLHACKECEASISLVHGHLNHRKECINALVKIWGHSTLLRTQFRAEPLLDSSKCKL